MKRKLVILVVVLCTIFAAHSQQLQNTYWQSYTPTGSPFNCYHFISDSLHYSYDCINYNPKSLYIESGNIFTIWDFLGACTQSSIGHYTFSIQNDTLDFTLISDDCLQGRSTVLGTYIFVRMYPTGIENISSDAVELYPNPSPNGIFNLRSGGFEKIIVCDAQGRKVFEENIPDGKQDHSINLQQLSPGIYFLTLQNQDRRRVFKIIR
jgi:hypothetical protein